MDKLRLASGRERALLWSVCSENFHPTDALLQTGQRFILVLVWFVFHPSLAFRLDRSLCFEEF